MMNLSINTRYNINNIKKLFCLYSAVFDCKDNTDMFNKIIRSIESLKFGAYVDRKKNKYFYDRGKSRHVCYGVSSQANYNYKEAEKKARQYFEKTTESKLDKSAFFDYMIFPFLLIETKIALRNKRDWLGDQILAVESITWRNMAKSKKE